MKPLTMSEEREGVFRAFAGEKACTCGSNEARGQACHCGAMRQAELLAEVGALRAMVGKLEQEYDIYQRTLRDLHALCGHEGAPTTHGLDYTTVLGARLRRHGETTLALAASQAEVRELREKLRPHVCEVDEMSWHGEAMHCALCGATWNNGEKRNEPATPETHKPECLLSRPPGDDTALREVCRKVAALAAVEGAEHATQATTGALPAGSMPDPAAIVNRVLGQPGDDAAPTKEE